MLALVTRSYVLLEMGNLIPVGLKPVAGRAFWERFSALLGMFRKCTRISTDFAALLALAILVACLGVTCQPCLIGKVLVANFASKLCAALKVETYLAFLGQLSESCTLGIAESLDKFAFLP